MELGKVARRIILAAGRPLLLAPTLSPSGRYPPIAALRNGLQAFDFDR
jgi:hypothetical protein